MTTLMLETKRLLLRPFRMEDSEDMWLKAGTRQVADSTSEMPFPLSFREAAEWVAYMKYQHEIGEQVVLVMELKKTKEMLGSIELILEKEHTEAELGYWLGYEYWGHGYCTEAAQEMVKLGFEHCDLKRIYSVCFEFNGASRRVIQKSGLKFEKNYPIFVEKWERFDTVEQYHLTADEYFATKDKK